MELGVCDQGLRWSTVELRGACDALSRAALAAGVSVSGRANVCNGSLADVLELDERDSRQITTKSCPRNQTFNGLQRCEPFLFDRAGNGLGQTTASVMILVSRPTDRRQSTSDQRASGWATW